MSKLRVNKDFGVYGADIFETLQDAVIALEDAEDIKTRMLHDRLDMQLAILRTAVIGNVEFGKQYALTYKIPSHLKSIDDNDVLYYVCPDYEDLVRCARLEQDGKCKILTINGVEWDKDDYHYYFADEKGE